MKYKIPNHTQIPNDFIDKDMRKLNGSETKVFLVICRKTIGWHKESDYISISQIMEKTGISNRVVIKSAKSLDEMGFITRQATKHTTMYTINFDSQNDEKSQNEDVHRVTKGHRGSDEKSQVGAKSYDEKSHTKETSNLIRFTPEQLKYKSMFKTIETWFKSNNNKYWPDAKQGKHIQNIAKRTIKIGCDIEQLLNRYKGLTNSDDKYWGKLPLTPSSFYSNWDSVEKQEDEKPESTYLERKAKLIKDGLI